MTLPQLAYTLAEAAQMTRVSEDMLKAAVGNGALRAKRTGVAKDGRPCGRYLFTAADLEQWLEGLADG